MTIVANAATLSAVVANGVSCDKVYMNGVLVFESVNMLTIGSDEDLTYWGFYEDLGIGAVTSTEFYGFSGRLIKLLWENGEEDDTLIEVSLGVGAFDISAVKITIDTIETIIPVSNSPWYVSGQRYYEQSPFKGLPYPGQVPIKLEVVV